MGRPDLIDNGSEIRARLAKLHPDAPRRWGRMTAHQMVCHCTDAFRNFLGERQPAATVTPHPVRERFMKWIALYAPLRWPQGMKTAPASDQEQGGTPPVNFERDMAALESACERFVAHLGSLTTRRHFVFGELSEREWARWGYLHLDHHLRQFGL
jgi:Protein of unknown function (DUF1569)